MNSRLVYIVLCAVLFTAALSYLAIVLQPSDMHRVPTCMHPFFYASLVFGATGHIASLVCVLALGDDKECLICTVCAYLYIGLCLTRIHVARISGEHPFRRLIVRLVIVAAAYPLALIAYILNGVDVTAFFLAACALFHAIVGDACVFGLTF